MSFINLDDGSRFHNYLKNYELKIFSTYVSTCKSGKNSKKGKNKGRYVKWESKRKLKNQYQLLVAEPPPLAPLIS